MARVLSALEESHPFSWSNLMIEPKKDHGEVYKRAHKDLNWFTLYDEGGFIRLLTLRGANYLAQQNLSDHITADWKIHFSIDHQDIPKAWNIVAAIFMDSGQEFAMKATVSKKTSWPSNQRGRELTVYIFVHDISYEAAPEQWDYRTYLGVEYERSSEYWLEFISSCEQCLAQNNISSNGLAEGDLALPDCKYASIRNEAFVDDRYPANELGFNAAGHFNPLSQLQP